MTRQVANDYGKDKIHVNAILPGGESPLIPWGLPELKFVAIKTLLLEPIMSQPTLNEGMIARHPWESFGEPKHIAGAALFLASEEAAFITGAMLPVDGGFIVQ